MQFRDKLDLLPLRQAVTPAGDAASAFATRGLLDWLSKPDRFQIISHGHGGQILAIGELALTEAQQLLRQAYGALVGFGEPTVHTYVDPQAGCLMVPVMFLRVEAPRAHATELLRIVEGRAARVQEVDVQKHRVVLRAELRLSRLIGLERAIVDATGGSAHILCWLLRYEAAGSEEEPAGAVAVTPAGADVAAPT
jgi:hypothetical protein